MSRARRDVVGQRASELHGHVAGMVEHLGQLVQGLVEELRTVADPDAADLQIEAVASQAAEQLATAEARASRAEQAHRRAEAERAEADAAAEEASALSEQLRAGLDESGQRLAKANAERDGVIADLADARATDEAVSEQSSARLVDLAERLTVTEARLVEAHADRTPRRDEPKRPWSRSPRPKSGPGPPSTGSMPSRRAPPGRRTQSSRYAGTWCKPNGERRSSVRRSAICAGSWRR